MRLYLLLVATLLMHGQAAFSAECTTPAEDKAFAVIGLRNEMMLTALTCSAQPQYNAFMSKFDSGISAQEKVITAHFQRVDGRGATKAHDAYITLLANNQSDEGLKSAGNQICRRNMPMFEEMTYLHDLPELATYAQSKGIADPPNACPVAVSAEHHGTHHGVRHHTTR